MGICWVAVIGKATCCFANELDSDAFDLQPCFDVNYSFDKVVVGVNASSARSGKRNRDGSFWSVLPVRMMVVAVQLRLNHVAVKCTRPLGMTC